MRTGSRESASGLAVEVVWPGARTEEVFRQLPRAEVVIRRLSKADVEFQ